MTKVFRQEDKQERIDVQSGEDQAMSDDLNGDKGFGAWMRGHVLNQEQHLDRQPDHVEDKEDDDLRPRVSLFPAEFFLRRFRSGRQTKDQMTNDETVQNDDEHERAAEGTEAAVHDFVLTRVDERVNVRARGSFHAVVGRIVAVGMRKGGGKERK